MIYETYAQRLKDQSKEIASSENIARSSSNCRKRLLVYSFAITDIIPRLYISFGSNMRSEREYYDKAINLLASLGKEVVSMTLDRYYLSTSYVDRLVRTNVFIIPRKNETLYGS